MIASTRLSQPPLLTSTSSTTATTDDWQSRKRGWQTCGYVETWKGTADATGKQQTGYIDPFGKPIKEAILHAKAANGQAVRWHECAGSLDDVYSNRRRQQ